MSTAATSEPVPPTPKESYVAPPTSLKCASLLPPQVPRILFPLSNHGHEPTEVVVVWQYLTKEIGWEVVFATEDGQLARADEKLLDNSIFRKLMGPTNVTIEAYYEMVGSKTFLDMKRFGGEEEGRVKFTDFDAVYLPGGHDKTMIPWFFSKSLHDGLASYVPFTVRHTSPIPTAITPANSAPKPQFVLAAICHGVLPLAFAKYPPDYPDSLHAGKPVIHNLETSTLPQWMEGLAWGVSQVWRMGEYYRTFSRGVKVPMEDRSEKEKDKVEWTEGIVCKALDDQHKQFKRGPYMPYASFTHIDPNHHYVSARFPGDVKELAINLVKEICVARQRFVDELIAGMYGEGTSS